MPDPTPTPPTPAPTQNALVWEFVVGFLGSAVILALVGIIVLACLERPVPAILTQIVTGAITVLLSFLPSQIHSLMSRRK